MEIKVNKKQLEWIINGNWIQTNLYLDVRDTILVINENNQISKYQCSIDIINSFEIPRDYMNNLSFNKPVEYISTVGGGNSGHIYYSKILSLYRIEEIKCGSHNE